MATKAEMYREMADHASGYAISSVIMTTAAWPR